jgi:hypothetical protein
MKILLKDFNNAHQLCEESCKPQWDDLLYILTGMPLHLKASDQAGIQGQGIFDPVGTNEYLKQKLSLISGWNPNVPIPKEYNFLGKDVDFTNGASLVEVQFSNYPFLLNNLIRSQLFINGNVCFNGFTISMLTIITKSNSIPSSNSTLYFEQAVSQINALVKAEVCKIPVRVIGLTEDANTECKSIWTDYKSARYSRIINMQKNGTACLLYKSAKSNTKYKVTFE